ncbi:sulfate permease [candidate division KSB3 bacterium]|uniref:Sulfate permease n=1 Tax=candidate division KSB3 bacterium TaxID=2044937 RepID=A0A9D5Q4D3_9BACT|nr:sulfate permease [candidate division KSB3 bacterium]MBD3323594.1 sulfate permease [candidate division KSB3 bacterium]
MLKHYLPVIDWLGHYDRRHLPHDLTAGVTVAIMLVPQAMAYAMLAGLPPVIGLYASTVPVVAYAVFGTSRQLAVGPVAIVSLLVYVGTSPLAEPGSSEYLSLTLLLAFTTGIVQLVLGVLRLGFLVNFLSHAVISGFTSAAAIVIGLSQLKHLLGVQLSREHSIFQVVYQAGRNIGQTNLMTLGIGVASIVLLLVFKKHYPRFPAPLLVVALGTLSVYAFQLQTLGVAIVGEVPQGMPTPSLPPLSLESVKVLLPTTLTIVFVGFMESIAVAQSLASKEKYKVEANQEFIGLGAANIVSALFSGYPVTGGFSRTAVNYQAGAKTGLAGMITAALMMLTLLFLTPLFYYLPKSVLAAIIMVAVSGLIDVQEAVKLFRLKPVDGWTLLLTFLCTLMWGVEQGIILGVVFSLVVFIWRSAHPHTAELGYIEADGTFLNIERFPAAKTFPKTLILRIDAALFFANMRFIEHLLRDRLVERPEVTQVVLDLSGVNDVDAVAIDTLKELVETHRDQGIRFEFAGMKGPVRDLFVQAEWEELCGHRIEYRSLPQVLSDLGVFP